MLINLFKILFKIVILILSFLFVMYLSILLLFPKNFNVSKFKSQIENEIYNQTGLEAGIEDISLKTSLSPYIYINAYHVILLYPNKQELLKIKDLNLKIKVLPLVLKKIKIDKITLNRPILSFRIEKDGTCSLDKFLSLKMQSNGDFSGFKIDTSIPDLEINRYKIKIFEAGYKQPFVAEGERIKLEPIGKNSDEIKTSFSGVLSYNGRPYITYSSELETFIADFQKKLFKTNPFECIRKFNINCDISSNINFKKDGDKIKAKGSANIKNLSFILDNQKLDNNFINIKFKDNEVSIDSDLKTSIKDRIKISGTSTFGKNPNINLKCYSNNVDLKNLSETIVRIMNLLNIKNEFSEYSLKGRANLDFIIRGNKNSIHSDGFAEIVNASIIGKNIHYNINGINSKINFDNNNIRIAPSKMLINGTPISFSGDIDKNTNLNISVEGKNLSAEKMSKIFLSDNIYKNYLFKGNIDFNSNIKGNFKKIQPEINSKLEQFSVSSKGKLLVKFSSGEVNLSGNLNEPDINVELKNANILPVDFNNNLKSDKFKINIIKNNLEIPETKVLFAGSPLLLAGKIEDIKNNQIYDIILSGKVSSASVYDLIKKQINMQNVQAATKGAITIKTKITGKGNKPDIQAEVDSDKDNYISFVVIKELLNLPSKIIFHAVFNEDELIIKDFVLNKKLLNNTLDKIAECNGKIKLEKESILKDFKIIIPKSLSFSSSKLKNSEVSLKSNILLNGKVHSPQIEGILDINDISIPEYKIQSTLNNIIFEKDIIKLKIPDFRIGESKFDISANLNLDSKDKIILRNMMLKADLIDLDEINEIFSDVNNNSVYPGVKIPITASSGKIDVKIFKTGGFQAENIVCDVSIIDNILKMTNISGTAYKGLLSGKAEYDFLQTTTKSELIGKNADMHGLIKSLTGKSDETTGFIDYKLKLNSIGTKRIQQLRTAKGFVDFTAHRGVMGTLGQFEHFLYAQNLISASLLKTTVLNISKAVKPKNTGIYTVAKGNIEISGGNAYLKPVTVEGPNMSLYIQGKINILNDMTDLKIYGRISQDIENMLGDLSNPIPRTIMSKSSETSIGNLFYDEYNTDVSEAIVNAIPQLNPDSGIPSRPFMVVIQGASESVKAVKSFKWIVSETNAPVPNIRNSENTQKQLQDENMVKESPISNPANPSFLDNLPNEFR